MPSAKKSIFTLVILLSSLTIRAQQIFKTPSGKKYHLATCRMVKNVSQEITIKEAGELGLSPCQICRPQSIVPINTLVSSKASGESSSVQCHGLTKAGGRCRHMTRIANGYCFQHQP